jgi:hypothetical protein
MVNLYSPSASRAGSQLQYNAFAVVQRGAIARMDVYEIERGVRTSPDAIRDEALE